MREMAGDDTEALEAARLAELHRLRILDTKPESDFDLITRTAAAIFDVPISLVSLVDARRQWFKARYGLGVNEAGRDVSFCSHAIEQPRTVTVIPDATQDERFARNPFVTGDPGIRFYAGAPLVTSAGYALGTLCVIDKKARSFDAHDRAALSALADLAIRLIERRPEAEPAPLSRAGHHPPAALVAFEWDAYARVSSWSRAAQAMLGWTSEEVLGRFPPFIAPVDAERYRRDCEAAFAGAADVLRLCTIRTKHGDVRQVAIAFSRAMHTGGDARGVSTVEDFGARLATERRLTMLESVVVNSSDAVVVTDAIPMSGSDYRIVFVNDAFTQMTGYSAAEAVGRTPRMLQGPRTDVRELERIARALQRREPVMAQVINYRKDGTEFWVEFNISPVYDSDGWCMYYIAVERDVTRRRALEKYEAERAVVLEMAVCNEPLATQLERIVVLLKGVIPGSLGTILLLDEDRLTVAAADPDVPAAYVAEIEGRRIGPNTGSCGTAAYLNAPVLCADVREDERWRAYRHIAQQFDLRACWSLPIAGTNGAVIGAFALYAHRTGIPTPHELQLFEETVRFASLVIERHRDRERLERMVLVDALTELPNRKLFERRFAAAATRALAAGHAVAVGVLDIDRFKTINDAFGHHVGDELLRSIAARLSLSLRDFDALARMAGDEFLVLFAALGTTDDGVEAALRLLRQFDEPFFVGGHEMFVRASLGLAFYPTTSSELSDLLTSADEAMYVAKMRGGGLELARSPQAGSALRKLDLEKDLRHALQRGEFALHYQLMFDLNDGHAVGAEALLRWNHAQFGLLAPGEFVPLAEANGAIVPIGKWVIEDAARVARAWQDAGRDAFVTVNVSALQFDEPGLVDTVVGALEQHGLEPHRLHLELTESLVMRNPVASAAMLLQLKGLGVRIVIDDFGTGYSSLAYLQRFSFDALKIDRAFVGGVVDGASNGRSERIVAAVIALGQALGVSTIAEGVEDPAQHAFVKSCGCTIVQGFLCARPVPARSLDWRGWNAPAHLRG